MGKRFFIGLCICVITKCVYGLPTATESSRTQNEDDDFDDEVHMLSYKKYLKEVMSLLMTDEQFRKKIMTEGKGLADKAKEFSMNLEFISQNIRSRLDEFKRKELDRLRNLLKLKTILKQSVKNLTKGEHELNVFEKEKLLAHLDYLNVNTFEASDLEKLIVQTSKDLLEIDRKRKEAFKIYEMEKELEKRKMLEMMEGEKRQEEEKKLLMMEEKHKDHPKMHHPGNEAHLLDIWEKIDGLDKKDFDPKTFFHLRDVNGDGLWDHNEVEALFQNELDKVYDKNAPEDDLVERYEEMNRMREHFISEADNNTDGVISLGEFISYSARDEFQSDEEWKAIDGKEVFDENDLKIHKVKLEKLKLQSREGVNEELTVETRILASNSSLAEAQPPPQRENEQLKFQPDQEVLGKQQALKGDHIPHVIHEALQTNQHKQMQQNQSMPPHKDQPPEQVKVEN